MQKGVALKNNEWKSETIENKSSSFNPNNQSKKTNLKSGFPAISEQSWFWGLGNQTKDLHHKIEIAARISSNVVIVGETGTGKELVANLIHDLYAKVHHLNQLDAPFIPVNCGAIPAALAESILFGHEKGAFTSARNRQYGKFELAKKGTLFLDEIQNMDLSLQAKMLRVLQKKEIDRLGARGAEKVHCRVITATNIPLEILVDKNAFRKDLFYRLNIFPIYIPSLRHRKEDLPVLIKGLCEKIKKERGFEVPELTEDAFSLLLEYSWPGNIRELEHALIYSALHSDGEKVEVENLPAQITGALKKFLTEGDWQI